MISIRPARLDDEEALYDAVMESRAELAPWMPWCRPEYSIDDARAFLERAAELMPAGEEYEFAIVEGDRFLGCCGLNQLDLLNRRANLGYWVRTSATRRGAATAATRQLAQWAFANTDLHRLEITISTRNLASLRVAEKAGAVKEGLLRQRIMLLGEAHDAIIFSILR